MGRIWQHIGVRRTVPSASDGRNYELIGELSSRNPVFDNELTQIVGNADLHSLRQMRAFTSRSVENNDHCSLPTIVFFYTYIVPLVMGRARCLTYKEGILLGFTVPIQPNLRAVKCQHALNLFEDCPFNTPVIIRIMVPVGD